MIMYNLNKPFQFHIELTDKCNALCPSCMRTEIDKLGILKQSNIVKNREIYLDDFKRIFSRWDKEIYEMFFCGNLGDPIAAKDLLEIIQFSKQQLNPQKIVIHTNGSLKSLSWWKNLAVTLKDINHEVEFGIDGMTQQSHSRYRVNTLLSKILKNAEAFIQNGGNAIWKMVIFKHNQNEVEECEKQSKKMKFTKFIAEPSTRFEDKTISFSYNFKGTKNELTISDKYQHFSGNTASDPNVINCFFSRKNSIYIKADGTIHNCCWLSEKSNDSHQSLQNRIIYSPSENKSLLECAVTRWSMKDLPASLKNNPNPTCVNVCANKKTQFRNI